MCEAIREEFKIGKIIFMPAKIPPHKDAAHIIDASNRLEMVKLAITDNPYFEVSDMEMKREGASYTVDTLIELHQKYGINEKIGLIVGADSLVNFKTWRNYPKILSQAKVIVASRPDTDPNVLDKTINELTVKFQAHIYKSSAEAMNYSSTEIRERVNSGLSIRYRVPALVEEYIYEHRLYR